MRNLHPRVITLIILSAIGLGYMIYDGMQADVSTVTPPTTGSVLTGCVGFECEIDQNLAIQKRIILSQIELMISQKELEATLDKVKQNIDMNGSAITTVQSSLNDTFKSAYYSGVNAFR